MPFRLLVLALVLASPALAQTALPLPPPDTVHVVVHETKKAAAPAPAAPSLDACIRGGVPSEGSPFAFNHFGVALNDPGRRLEEGGDVEVHVYAEPGLVDRLRVQRTTGPVDVDRAPFAGVHNTKSFVAGPPRSSSGCTVVRVRARDLAGGRETFRIDYFKPDGAAVALGEFSLPVARRYAGIATFGVVASFIEGRQYTLVPEDPAADSVRTRVAVTEEAARFRYLIGLSPFLAPRAVRPGTWRPLELAPFAGFDLERPLSNLYLGAQASVADVVYLTGGLHVGRVTRLPDGVEVEDGDRYSGAAVPTVEATQIGGFIGLTADAQLALSALGGLIKGLAK